MVQLTALLHGHSYTAHAMGCSAAVKAIQWFRDPSTNSNLDFDRMKLKEVMNFNWLNLYRLMEEMVSNVSLCLRRVGTLSIISMLAIQLNVHHSNMKLP